MTLQHHKFHWFQDENIVIQKPNTNRISIKSIDDTYRIRSVKQYRALCNTHVAHFVVCITWTKYADTNEHFHCYHTIISTTHEWQKTLISVKAECLFCLTKILCCPLSSIEAASTCCPLLSIATLIMCCLLSHLLLHLSCAAPYQLEKCIELYFFLTIGIFSLI